MQTAGINETHNKMKRLSLCYAFIASIKKIGMKKKTNQLKEPEALNKLKFISGPSSLEEMETEQLIYFASLTPEELLINHKELSLKAFGLKVDTNINKTDRSIKFANNI